MNFEYRFGRRSVTLNGIQIEVDLTIEYDGTVGVFEAKNGKPDSFSIYQIYHPFLYYHMARNDEWIKDRLKEIISVYLVRTVEDGINNLKLWAYTFDDPYDLLSIRFLKSRNYKLIM